MSFCNFGMYKGHYKKWKTRTRFFPTGGWAKGKAGLNAHRPLFPPHLDKAEPETLDTGVWLGGVWRWCRTRIHLSTTPASCFWVTQVCLHTQLCRQQSLHACLSTQQCSSCVHPSPFTLAPTLELLHSVSLSQDWSVRPLLELTPLPAVMPRWAIQAPLWHAFHSAFACQVSLAQPEKEH